MNSNCFTPITNFAILNLRDVAKAHEQMWGLVEQQSGFYRKLQLCHCKFRKVALSYLL
jgi:hypothetical protein